MRALSILQPWASLVAIGAKRFETRSWSTHYRGPLAIHASKHYAGDELFTAGSAPFRAALASAGLQPSSLPCGAIIAVGTLERVLPVDSPLLIPYLDADGGREVEFGDYSPGRFAWEITGVKQLREPIPYKGALGLWAPPPIPLAAVGAS